MKHTMFGLLSVISLIVGCSKPPGIGDDGNAKFEYSSADLFTANYSWRPMLVHTTETIVLHDTQDVPQLTPDSSNPAVVTITSFTNSQQCCTGGNSGSCAATTLGADECHSRGGVIHTANSVFVGAQSVGTSRLTMRRADGSEFDTIMMTVSDAATIKVNSIVGSTVTDSASSVSVEQGAMYRLEASAFGSDGEQLEARFGLTATSDNTSVTGLRVHMLFGGSFVQSVDGFDIEGNSPTVGTASVTFSSGTVTSSVAVRVH